MSPIPRRIALAALPLALAACTGSSPSASTRETQPATASVSPEADVSPTPTAVADPTPIPHELAEAPNEELREELLAMFVLDQAVRTGVAPPGDDRTAEELLAAMPSVDRANTERMKEILDAHGWPGWSLVGKKAATAAWAIVQHADLDPEFQELGLAYLMGAVEAGDASPGDLAYLIDRVRVAKGLPQVYGTQIGAGPDGELAPQTPIEDPANVDARRAAAGLGTLEEYFDEIREAFGTPAPSPTSWDRPTLILQA